MGLGDAMLRGARRDRVGLGKWTRKMLRGRGGAEGGKKKGGFSWRMGGERVRYLLTWAL